MTAHYPKIRREQSRSSLWWLSAALWSLVGLMLVVAFLDHQAISSGADADAVGKEFGVLVTDRAEPAAPRTSPVSSAGTETSTTDAVTAIAADRPTDGVAATAADRRPVPEDGATSDFVRPLEEWGAYAASCPDSTFLVYAARTEPRKYEYAVCSQPDGKLAYHGIDVDRGSEIRLDACVAGAGRYVAYASRDYRYEIVDARRGQQNGDAESSEATESNGTANGTLSQITLYRSTTGVDWRYGVHSEWGMQNLPTEFIKC